MANLLLASSRMPANVSLEEHRAAIDGAFQAFDISPERVVWHYLQAAFITNDANVSVTARKLGMHRRTLQRILEKNAPLVRRAAS